MPLFTISQLSDEKGLTKDTILFRLELDIVTRTRIVAQPDDPCESIQAIADGDIESLAEYAISLLGIGDHLGIATRDVEHDGVVGGCDLAAHLDVYT